MAALNKFGHGRIRRRWVVSGTVLLTAAVFLFVIGAASAVLPGSPSKFESGNDPTLGLGNMIVNTAGNKDWISVTGSDPAYAHLDGHGGLEQRRLVHARAEAGHDLSDGRGSQEPAEGRLHRRRLFHRASSER